MRGKTASGPGGGGWIWGFQHGELRWRRPQACIFCSALPAPLLTVQRTSSPFFMTAAWMATKGVGWPLDQLPAGREQGRRREVNSQASKRVESGSQPETRNTLSHGSLASHPCRQQDRRLLARGARCGRPAGQRRQRRRRSRMGFEAGRLPARAQSLLRRRHSQLQGLAASGKFKNARITWPRKVAASRLPALFALAARALKDCTAHQLGAGGGSGTHRVGGGECAPRAESGHEQQHCTCHPAGTNSGKAGAKRDSVGGLGRPLCTEGSATLAAAAAKLDPARSSRLTLV